MAPFHVFCRIRFPFFSSSRCSCWATRSSLPRPGNLSEISLSCHISSSRHRGRRLTFCTPGRSALGTKVTTPITRCRYIMFVRSRPGECKPCPRCYRTVLMLASARMSFSGLGEPPTATTISFVFFVAPATNTTGRACNA